MIDLPLLDVRLRFRTTQGKTCVFDRLRRKWLLLTPEEQVRQALIGYLCDNAGYPQGLMSIEKKISVGNLEKRFDLVIYDREYCPWMLVECKAPDVPITEKTLHQLLAYQRTIQGRYWLLCNGRQTYCADSLQHPVSWLDALPVYEL
jgi:hypothetical protein